MLLPPGIVGRDARVFDRIVFEPIRYTVTIRLPHGMVNDPGTPIEPCWEPLATFERPRNTAIEEDDHGTR
jgi:hypothetical protein